VYPLQYRKRRHDVKKKRSAAGAIVAAPGAGTR
jgi:hypothetical protein